MDFDRAIAQEQERTRAVNETTEAYQRQQKESIDAARRTTPKGKPERSASEIQTQAAGDLSSSFGSFAALTGNTSFNLADDIFQTVEYLPRFQKGIADLGQQLLTTGGITQGVVGGLSRAIGNTAAQAAVGATALGAIGVAIAGVAIAVNQFNVATEASQRALDAQLEAQDNYYQALQSSTVEDVTAQLEALTGRQTALGAQIAEASGAVERQFSQTAAAFSDPIARLIDTQSGVSQLREQLQGLQTEFDTNAGTINRLTEGLQQGAFATADATAAEKALADERARAAGEDVAATRADIERQIELRRLREESTTAEIQGAIDAARSRRQAIEDEISEFGRFNARGDFLPAFDFDESDQAVFDALNEDLDDITDQIHELRDVAGDVDLRETTDGARALFDTFVRAGASGGVLEQFRDAVIQAFDEAGEKAADLDAVIAASKARRIAAEAREAAEEAATRNGDNYLEALEAEGNARDKLTAATNDYNEAIADANTRLNELRADTAQRLTDSETETAEQRTAAAAQFAKDSQQAEKDYAKERLNIERDAQRGLLNAVGNRDALAAYEAQQQQREALRDAEEGFTERADTLRESQVEEARDLEQALSKQRAQIQRDGEQRLQQEAIRAAREQQTRSVAVQRAQVDLLNATNSQNAIYANHFANTTTIVRVGTQQIEGHFLNAINNINRAAAQMPIARVGTGGGTSGTMRAIANQESRRVLQQVLRD